MAEWLVPVLVGLVLVVAWFVGWRRRRAAGPGHPPGSPWRALGAGIALLGGLGLVPVIFLNVFMITHDAWLGYQGATRADGEAAGLLVWAIPCLLLAALLIVLAILVRGPGRSGWELTTLFGLAGAAFVTAGALGAWTGQLSAKVSGFGNFVAIAGALLALATPWWDRWWPR